MREGFSDCAIELTEKGLSYIAKENTDSALWFFNLALAADSNNVEAHYRRGNILFDKGNYFGKRPNAHQDYLWLANRNANYADVYSGL